MYSKDEFPSFRTALIFIVLATARCQSECLLSLHGYVDSDTMCPCLHDVSSCPTAAPQARIRADRGQLEKLL